MGRAVDMGFLSRWIHFFRRKEAPAEEEAQEPEKSFFLYRKYAPRILAWMRRESRIPKKNLELAVIDNEEEPAWEVEELLETLSADLNLMYVLTGRAEAFEELSENVFEERGLLLVLTAPPSEGKFPGNLTLDLREWERQFDLVMKQDAEIKF